MKGEAAYNHEGSFAVDQGIPSGGDVTIGIVTCNHASSIIRTLECVYECIVPYHSADIVVWDNNSSDGTADLAENTTNMFRHPAVRVARVIRSEVNVGFGAAHNAIAGNCRTRYYAIYNPDLYATDGCLIPLLNALEHGEGVMIAAPRFSYPDGALQPLCRRDPGVLDLFLRFFAIGLLRRFFAPYLDRASLVDVGYTREMNVPIASGAMMCMRTSDFRRLGGFDKRYFLYFEDYDLCRKVREAGGLIRYVPQSRFVHEWKRESRRSLRAVRLLYVSAWKYFRKWGVNWGGG